MVGFGETGDLFTADEYASRWALWMPDSGALHRHRAGVLVGGMWMQEERKVIEVSRPAEIVIDLTRRQPNALSEHSIRTSSTPVASNSYLFPHSYIV